jgi:DNA phosphorothioation system restriction enzyme
MTLDNLKLKSSYRSSDGSIVDNFYIPCLQTAIIYKRAVGYFTSEGLAIAAKGLHKFLNRENSYMRLIASPQLNEKDIQAIEKGYESRNKIIEEALIEELEEIENDIIKDRLNFLAWMIAKEKLDIKLAFMKNHQGIYHEKVGIFLDSDENLIAFSGSPNETKGGLYNNYEAIDVYLSWKENDRERAIEKNQYFDSLWNNKINGLQITDFPQAAKEKLIRYKSRGKPHYDPESISEKKELYRTKKINIPDSIDLRGYQKKAIESWIENNGRGTMKMATGTGKTVTALSAMVKLDEFYKKKEKPYLIIVICPYIHLVNQWDKEAKNFGYDPILCYQSKHHWLRKVNPKINSLNSAAIENLFLITTNTTFAMTPFQNILKNVYVPKVIIADEMHNLGSKKLSKKLPEFIERRLGLSATPERWFDEAGTEYLYKYFGKTIIEFNLEQAISKGFLTPYDYYPVLIQMTENEMEEYKNISKEIAAYSNSEESLDDNEKVKHLLIKRARLKASAKNKIPELKRIIEKNNLIESTHNLVYCGDGSVDTGTNKSEQKQISLVTKMLGKKLGMFVNKYIAETPNDKRKLILNEFSEGKLNALVAIKCLDEGVDIPAIKRAFILASSTNPRQFIQRRGRVLRRYSGKDKAQIWDFLVIPSPDEVDDSTFNLERNLIKSELKRVIEFTKIARNGPQAEEKLIELKKKYGLMHM